MSGLSERDVERLAEFIAPMCNNSKEYQDWPTLRMEMGKRIALAILASGWLAERDAAIRAEAEAEGLRDAADQWTQGQWSDVMLPKPVPPAVPVIDYSNRVGEWLRECAALLDGGDL